MIPFNSEIVKCDNLAELMHELSNQGRVRHFYSNTFMVFTSYYLQKYHNNIVNQYETQKRRKRRIQFATRKSDSSDIGESYASR